MKTVQRCLQGLGAMLVVSLAAAQVSPPSQEMMVDIKLQPVIGALNDWAQQTGLQLVVPEEATDDDVMSQGITGKYTAQQALEKLLTGTRLTYAFINARTVAIGMETRVAARPHLVPGLQEVPRPTPLAAGLEKVTVTGSRLPNEDIRADGSVDTPAPVTVFNRERIDELGVSTVGELMKYVSQQPLRRFEGSGLSGPEHFELRGVGIDSTLVLINGRRTVPSANTVAANAFDLNSIPLVAVDRVEIVSDSAAAVYGADAVGGVVNIILKTKAPGVLLDFHSGAADGGAGEHRGAVAAGYSNDRFDSLVLLDYFDRSWLLGADRERWSDQNFERFGGGDWRTTATNPGNVRSLTGNLPGLPSAIAAVPTGSSGVGLEPADFLATAGQLNKESLLSYRTIVPAADRRSMVASAHFNIAPRLSAFGELFYIRRKSVYQHEPFALDDAIVPAANPFNPFHTDVAVDYLLTGLGSKRSTVTADLYRGVAGLRGTLDDWDWELSALRIDEDSELVASNSVDPAKVLAALSASDPGEALNVFQDGPGGSPALLASLLADPTATKNSSTGSQGAAIFRGPIGRLPGGIVEAVVGAEWLRSSVFSDDIVHVQHGRTTTSAFAELRIPVVSSAMNVPLVHGLSFTVAARNDRYSDVGDSFNPQYGLFWKPTSDLMLRASYGTSFRAPSLFELFAPQQEVPNLRIPDSRRNNEIVPVAFLIGGNPDLEPTEAESFTGGFVLTPGWLQGLRLSSSYWRIRMDNRINVLPYFAILANEERFADRVVRAAPTDPGLPGVLQALDVTRINFGGLETSGVDGAAEYSIETRNGRFWQTLSATWMSEYRKTNLPGDPAVDSVGVADFNGSVLRWRAIATVGWSKGGIALSATGRYSPAYDDANSRLGPTGRRIDSQVLLDMQATLDVDEYFGDRPGWLPALKLTAGISNLFDEEPGFSELIDGLGFDPTQGDLRQRFAYMRLSSRF